MQIASRAADAVERVMKPNKALPFDSPETDGIQAAQFVAASVGCLPTGLERLSCCHVAKECDTT